MYSKFELVCKYIAYYFASSSGKGHGIHSPFVYDFVEKVLNNTNEQTYYRAIENRRNVLKNCHQEVEIQDFGAGSRVENATVRTVSSIAKSSLKSPKYAQLLNKIVAYFSPNTILELGTCLGITTAYLAKAQPVAQVFTMEGAEAIANIAEKNLKTLGVENVNIIRGNFDATLSLLLNKFVAANQKIDFAFIDGNHREVPTIQYFEQLLPFIDNNTILVFDDIHWSKGMENAWQQIIQHQSVRLSIDLFFIGIVFFRKEQKEKQHFTIRY